MQENNTAGYCLPCENPAAERVGKTDFGFLCAKYDFLVQALEVVALECEMNSA